MATASALAFFEIFFPAGLRSYVVATMSTAGGGRFSVPLHVRVFALVQPFAPALSAMTFVNKSVFALCFEPALYTAKAMDCVLADTNCSWSSAPEALGFAGGILIEYFIGTVCAPASGSKAASLCGSAAGVNPPIPWPPAQAAKRSVQAANAGIRNETAMMEDPPGV